MLGPTLRPWPWQMLRLRGYEYEYKYKYDYDYMSMTVTKIQTITMAMAIYVPMGIPMTKLVTKPVTVNGWRYDHNYDTEAKCRISLAKKAANVAFKEVFNHRSSMMTHMKAIITLSNNFTSY